MERVTLATDQKEMARKGEKIVDVDDGKKEKKKNLKEKTNHQIKRMKKKTPSSDDKETKGNANTLDDAPSL